jgi:hypothetical protein
MASDIVNCFGVNLENLNKENSTVSVIPMNKDSRLKFDEGFVQRLFKLVPDHILKKQDLVATNYQYSIFSSANSVLINDQSFSLDSRIIDIQAYQNTLYVLHNEKVSIYKLPQMKIFKSYPVNPSSCSIKVRNFGDLVYIQSSMSILRIDSLNYVHTQSFSSALTAMDSVFGSDSQVCVCFETKELKIIDFCSSEVSLSFKTSDVVDQVFSVSEKVIFFYSSKSNTLASFSCENEEVSYVISFNSNVAKVFKYCEETEQFLFLNKNSCKFFVLSLDEDARVSKYVAFAVNRPVSNFFHMVIANDLPDQALYEGNSAHKVWMSHEDNIGVYSLDVVSTKTAGYRFGPANEPLSLDPSYLVGQSESSVNETLPVMTENSRLHLFDLPSESVYNGRPSSHDQSPSKVYYSQASPVRLRPESPPLSIQMIENCIKKELSSEKVNIITSQIAFKLEEILPDSLKSAFSIAAPSISTNIRELVQSSVPELKSTLAIGLEELKNLQREMFLTLESLKYSENNSNIHPDMTLVPKETEKITLKALVLSKDDEKFRKFLVSGEVSQMILETPPEDLFELGNILFDSSLAGSEAAAGILEMVCKCIPENSENFAAFYVRISNTGSMLLRESQKILEQKF